VRSLYNCGLSLVALFYAAVVRLRTYFYRKKFFSSIKVSPPVISVGNITVGGNGKTPLCLFLAQSLKARGFSPVILMRGYKGNSVSRPRQITSNDSVEEVGDEALLVAERSNVPVVVAKNKYLGARFIEEKLLGNIIVLDDGHQHLALEREVNIVLADVSSEKSVRDLVEGKMLPAGRWRESFASGMARADVVILNRRSPGSPEEALTSAITSRLNSHTPFFKCSLNVEGVFPSLKSNTPIKEPKELGQVVAFCGLANPEPFFDTISSLGMTLVVPLTSSYLYRKGPG
jgi:tetraacyldisaccharide 4'-kinase